MVVNKAINPLYPLFLSEYKKKIQILSGRGIQWYFTRILNNRLMFLFIIQQHISCSFIKCAGQGFHFLQTIRNL